MLKKILASLGVSPVASGPAMPDLIYRPYAEPRLNFLYNLLFCDDISLFRKQQGADEIGPWATLFGESPNIVELRKIADDQANEGRVRALAYNRLRAISENVPPKILLGVIVEVPLQQGLDVLAAFSEGGVRYLNQSGKVAIFEGQGNPLEDLAKQLIATSQPLVNQIGPWDKQRLPPPKAGNVRMTFLVSDGLYFGEGPFGVLQKDSMASSILAKAGELLQKAVDLGSK